MRQSRCVSLLLVLVHTDYDTDAADEPEEVVAVVKKFDQDQVVIVIVIGREME